MAAVTHVMFYRRSMIKNAQLKTIRQLMVSSHHRNPESWRELIMQYLTKADSGIQDDGRSG